MSAGGEDNQTVARTAAAIAALYAVLAVPLAVSGPEMPPATMAASAVLAVGLAVLSAIDVKTLRLPDTLTLPLAAIGLGFAALLGWEPALLWRLGAAVAAYVFIWLVAQTYEKVRGRAGIGLGDGKLLAVAGAWLGPAGVPATLLYGCAGALLFVAVRFVARRPVGRGEALPFGPFLAAGLWLVWLYGPLV